MGADGSPLDYAPGQAMGGQWIMRHDERDPYGHGLGNDGQWLAESQRQLRDGLQLHD